jgi:hypothetical protein
VAFLGWGLTGRRLEGELAALRPVRLLDVGWVVMCLCTFAAAVVGCSTGGLAGAAVRNLVGFAGLVLVASDAVHEGLVGALPTAYALAATALGQTRNPAWWAWFLRPADDPLSWVLAVGAGCGGLLALLRRSLSRPG